MNVDQEKKIFLPRRALIECATIALAITLAEAKMVFASFGQMAALTDFMRLHFFLVGAVVIWSWSFHRRFCDLRLPYLLTVGTALFSFLGAGGALIAAISLLLFQHKGQLAQQWFAASVLVNDGSSSATKRDKAPQWTNERTQSLWDVIYHGNYAAKLRVIAELSRDLKVEFAPILRHALVDDEAVVRVQAATVIEKYEHRFTKKWIELQSSQTALDSGETELTLALHCDSYAYLGIADQHRIAEIREMALRSYQRYLAKRPQSPRVRLALVRILVRSGCYDEARAAVASAPLGPSTREEALWYCEALYALKEFELLRRCLKDRCGEEWLATLPRRVRSIVEIWSGWDAKARPRSNALSNTLGSTHSNKRALAST